MTSLVERLRAGLARQEIDYDMVLDLNDITQAADTIEALCEALESVIPSYVNLNNHNVIDSDDVPIDMTMGDLRKIAAALAKVQNG